MSTDMAKASREVVGENVRRFRTAKRLSQETLAADVGMSQPQLSALEKGKFEVRSDTVDRLAAALGVAPAQLWVPVEEVIAAES